MSLISCWIDLRAGDKNILVNLKLTPRQFNDIRTKFDGDELAEGTFVLGEVGGY